MKRTYSLLGRSGSAYKRFCSALIGVIGLGLVAQAQVSTYTFAQSSGTYTPVSGGTVLGTPGNDDVSFADNPIGFTFWYNGQSYTRFSVNSNGHIALGNVAITTFNYFPLSTGSSNNVISALSADIQGDAVTGDLRFTTIGTAPNRTLVVQWTNYDDYPSFSGLDVYNFQIRLSETTNEINVVYGTTSSTQIAGLFEVGLRGNTNADFNNRQVSNGIQTWATSIAGLANSSTCEMNATLVPASGQTYTWSPPPAPAAPTTLTFTAVTTSGMTLNWVDNSTNENSFFIERSLDNITFVPAGTVPSTSTATTGTPYTLVQTGLFSATLYYYRVYAVGVTPSLAVSGSQATLPGTLCGTFTIGPTGAYTSLTAAFAAVAANGVSCPLVFDLQAAYVSTVETFPINIPFLGNSPANTITVRPELGATNLSITSNAAQTINFNGAGNVSFDGRPGSVGTVIQLTIANTATTGAAVQIGGDASNCGLNYINVRSVNVGTALGAVQFTTPATTTGSSGHFITNCDFAPGATNPQQYIFSSNSLANSYISSVNISNNLFRDWFVATGQNAAMNLGGNIRNFTISNNSMYQTATRTFTTGVLHYGILISGSTAGSGGHIISGNFVGGTLPNCGGTAWTYAGTVATRLIGISVNGNSSGNTTPTSIQGNTFTNINMTTSASTTFSPGIICGIQTQGTTHNLNVGTVTPNVIGSVTAANAIVTNSSGSGGLAMGITNSSSGAVVISNNLVGGFSVNTSLPTVSSSFTGIQSSSGSPSTISGNTVGSLTLANSVVTAASTSATASIVMGINSSAFNAVNITNNTVMNLTSQYIGTSTGAVVRGIYSTSGINTITGNTVRNLATLAPNASVGVSASVQGISLNTFSTSTNVVNSNTINTLANGSTTGNVMVSGITISGTTGTFATTDVAYNNIAGMGAPLNTGTPIVYGINLVGNPTRVFNNFVNLGSDITGAAITAPNSFIGINKETSATAAVNFNTVNINGTGVTAGTANTAAYRRATTAIDELRNNVLVNTRSNGASTGTHFVLNLNNGTTFNSDNNDYFGNGTGFQTAVINAVNVTGVSGIILAIGGNGNSIAVNPNFVSATDLHINNATVTALESRATTLAYVSNDIDLQVRPGPTAVNGGGTAPDMGADEFDGIPLAVDIGGFAFLQPAVPGCYSASQTIRVRIRNYAGTALNMALPGNGVTVNVSVTGPNPQSFTLGPIISGIIPANGFLDTTVTTTYNMGAVGTYGFSFTATTATEVLTLNDGFGPQNITVSAGTALAAGGGRICLGAQGTLNVSGFTNGGTIQWQESPDNITWTNIVGATATTLTIVPTDTTFYRAVICGQHNSVVDTLFPQFVAPPTVTGATRCGTGPVTLTAAASGSIRWYNQPTAGTQVASGNTFTPTVSATTTYYVENTSGTPPTTITTTLAAGNGSSGNVFRVSALNTITITGMDGHMTSGTATWEIWGRPGDYTTVANSTTSNVGWTLLGTASNVVAAGLGVPTPLPITLNVVIPGGTDYSFIVTTTGPTLNYTNGTAVGNPLFTNADMIVREGHGGSYFGYTITTRNWNGRINYSAGCASFPRTPVTATVTPAPTIASTSSNVICGTGSTTLTVASSNPGYSYTWTPATALNVAAGDTVVSTPVNTTTYVVQATDTASGCVTFDTIQAVVSPAVVGNASVNNDTICGGSPVQLDVTFPPAVFTIGTQNVLNTTTTYPAPFGNWYWGAKHQMLITAAELTAAGMTTGFYSSLGFQLPAGSNTPAPSPPLDNFEIRIANTTLTAMTTSFQMSGFTSYYTNVSLAPTTGIMTLNFNNSTTPLWFWDGVSNIIIETCFNNTSFTGNWVFRQSSTSYTSTTVLFQDASGVCAQSSGFSTFNQRPNMIFTRSGGNNSYVWSGGTVSNPNIQNPTAAPFASTSYIVLITDTLTTCSLTDTVSVHVLPTPMPNFGPDTVICSNTPLLLDGTAGNYTYLWHDSTTTQTYVAANFGTYNVLVTDTTNGCTGTDTILVGVNAAPAFTLGADVTLCAGNSATFSGPPSANFTYGWSTSANTTNVETVNTAGNVALLVTDTTNGCFESDTAAVFVNPLPAQTLGNDTSICSSNAPIVISGPSGPYSYLWQDTTTNQSLSISSTGIYSVLVTDTVTTCFSNDTVVITVNATPAPALGNDTAICSANAPLVLAAPSGPFSYQWQDNTSTVTYSVNSTAVYSVLVTDSVTGCAASDSISVTVNATPVVALGNDTTFCGTSIVLSGPSGNLSYNWTPAASTQTITATTSGNYALVATDTATGCSGSDNINVVINNLPVVTLSLPFDTACTTDGPRQLTGGSPASGGIWNGPGVGAGAFNANTLSPGTYTITYTYTDINGCTNQASDLVVVDPCVGIEEQTAISTVTLFPNPNNGMFTLTMKGADYSEMSIEVLTVQGQILWSDMASNVQGDVNRQLDLTNYANGIYYVRVVADGKTFIQKVVKQD